jgi:diaminopimelate decarboxylase
MTQIPATTFADIAAQAGTPCYVYSSARIQENYQQLAHAFDPSHTTLCYSVKANGNLSILRLLRDMGAGFDVVSAGEMQRALLAGADPARIVFAGVGKRDDELVQAIDAGIGWINVESAQELQVLSDIAQRKGVTQQVALRLNPNIDSHTHRYMATGVGSSKFGIGIEEAMGLVANRNQFAGVAIHGVHIHIGSMVSEYEPYVDAMRVGLDVIAECRGMGAALTTMDLGGGFGVAYTPDQTAAPVEQIAAAVLPMAKDAGVRLQLEPGRSIIADAGWLLTRVIYTKTNGGVHYAIVDAAMNDLIRPALYGAKHVVTEISDLRLPIADVPATQSKIQNPKSKVFSVVGPICESGDKLAEGVLLDGVERGDLLLIHHAGAYGMSMSSNYNTRARAAEVLVEEGQWRVIRRRENMEALWAGEVECLQ